MDDAYNGDINLGGIFDRAAGIFGKWVDYDTKKSMFETQADLQRYQYGLQYRPRTSPMLGTDGGASLLPILLIGGMALVGVFLIAKA